jgi:hypothetical protein
MALSCYAIAPKCHLCAQAIEIDRFGRFSPAPFPILQPTPATLKSESFFADEHTSKLFASDHAIF